MTNPKRGECAINLNGTTYNTKINLDSIMRIETACQRSFLKIAQDLSSGDFQMHHIVFILQTAIRGGGTDIKDAAMKNIIWEAGIVEAIAAVGQIMSRAIAGDQSEDASGNEEEAAAQ